LVLALKLYARVLQSTRRFAQAELLETRAMVYAAKLKNKFKKEVAFASP